MTMKNRLILTIFTLFAVGALALNGPAQASANGAAQAGTNGPARADTFEREAERFVAGLGDLTAEIAEAEKNGTEAQRREKVYAFIDKVVDVPAIARFTMGRYWRKADARQRSEFTNLFRNYIALSLAGRITHLAGASFDIRKVLPVKASKARDVLVICRLELRQGRSLDIVWRVRKTKTGPRLVDVIVDGISMSVVQREEFASVLNAGDGVIDTFLAELRTKTEGAGHMVAERQD